MSELQKLTFSDIYLGRERSWLAGVPNAADPVPAPPECRSELVKLRENCEEYSNHNNKQEFTVRSDDITFRVSLLKSLADTVYVLRRFPAAVPKLSDLGIHTNYVERLMKSPLAGLVVIAGAFGQGKTTTASSLIQARLMQYGGVAITIEDPPEMPLEGRHGEGVCYQTWAEQNGFAQACRHAARWAPSMIFLGEVRDSETAAEAIRASINGRLVLCTTHADGPAHAIERIYALANGAAGTSEDVANLLASGLVAILHQKLEPQPNGERRLKAKFLWLGDDSFQGVRNIIRQRHFPQLENEVTLQFNKMRMGA